jgi:hypothetical protein
MTQRIAIRVDLGPEAPLDLLSEVIQSISTVYNLGVSLDRQSEINRAQRLGWIEDRQRQFDILANLEKARYAQSGPWGQESTEFVQDFGENIDRLYASSYANIAASPGPLGGWQSPAAQAAYLLGAQEEDSALAVPTVEGIRYENPLTLIIGGGGGVLLLGLLKFIRDYDTKRCKDKAAAQKTRAEADKIAAEAEETRARAYGIRSRAECEAAVTRVLLTRVSEGDADLTPEQIRRSLDAEAVGALLELTQRSVDFEDMPPEDATTKRGAKATTRPRKKPAKRAARARTRGKS